MRSNEKFHVLMILTYVDMLWLHFHDLLYFFLYNLIDSKYKLKTFWFLYSINLISRIQIVKK